MLVLLEAQEGNWDEIDLMVRTLQRTTQALRHANVPVVVCPCGMTLGGGCEILLHGDRVQAAAESYIGLVEVGVGLIPAGEAPRERWRAPPPLQRTSRRPPRRRAAGVRDDRIRQGLDERGACHAGSDLTGADGMTMNRERLISDAKAVALARVRDGYRPPPRRTSIPVGGDTLLAALNLGVHLAWRAGRIGDHDAVVGRAPGGAGRWRAPPPDDRERRLHPRPGTRSVRPALRRAEDARAHPVHVEDRQDVEELTVRIIERGAGTPLIVVPALQGRWEYFAPAVDALARSFRVMTFSLRGELGCPRIEPGRGIDNFADQIAAALDSRGLERAIVCGISFGGLAALRFAAERPERTAALVLASTPGPGST